MTGEGRPLAGVAGAAPAAGSAAKAASRRGPGPGRRGLLRRALLRAGLAPVLLLAAGWGWTPSAVADDAAWAALREPGAIALMRHAEAPGVGDPAGFRLDDCTTQRNLSEAGRADAAAVGRRLKAERIPVARVLSSPWCRCLETARLLELGPVTTEPAFRNAYVLRGESAEIAASARKFLREWHGSGTLVVVSHGENIAELTGSSPASGEIVVARVEPGGEIRTVGRIAPPPR